LIRTPCASGVLQRIAVVYLISSAIVLYCGRKARWVIAAVLLLGYWALMELYPVPVYGPGVLTMDGGSHHFNDLKERSGFRRQTIASASSLLPSSQAAENSP